jgi:ATPase subunit of ABC transporter with duplicated ATPase domains
MLDVPSITFLANYLQGYPSTVLVVSHDRAFLNEVATDIIHQHSERLDYYKGANFGMYCAVGNSCVLLTCIFSRILLRHQGRAEEERQARV